MSLSLTIRSDKKYRGAKTGVFVKDSGGTRELQTLDEIKVYYPDSDVSNISQEQYNSYNVWSGEIINNLSYLASHIPIIESGSPHRKLNLYYYLWKPGEIGYDYLLDKYKDGIEQALLYMKNSNNVVELLKYDNKENLEELIKFTESLFYCLKDLKINYSDEFEIIVQK